ncbi:MAG: hypothetical protein CME19_01330 [Gemmatimonadetes bacterium]|nr:hypothetical protein [Gemmatimonadota bacterium]
MYFSSIVLERPLGVIGQRRGNQALLSIGTWFRAFSIAIPLTVTWIPSIEVDLFVWAGLSVAFDLRVVYYALTFVFSGFAMSGMFTGRWPTCSTLRRRIGGRPTRAL